MNTEQASKVLRIFISSPSDVRPERLIAERVIQRLDREFSYYFRVMPVLWERQPLVASHHFQDEITPPSETDIVIVILWSRLGILLPEDKFPGPLSRKPVTGTEWEFEEALKANRETNLPDLLMYRKKAEASLREDEEAIRAHFEQKRLVEDFIRTWFLGTESKSFTAAFREFTDAVTFEELLETHLRELLKRRLERPEDELVPASIRWHQGSPFRGLLSFESHHTQVFFGRTRARNELRELLVRRAELGSAFLLVMGASGSGKSSLVKAGLLADLTLPGMVAKVALVRHAILRPADGEGNLLHLLAAAVLKPSALPELESSPFFETAENLAALLRTAPDRMSQVIRQGLAAAGRAANLTDIAESRLLIIIDQLEEIFTAETNSAVERDLFVAALEALATCGSVWVVATMRSDFFDRLETVPRLLQLSAESRYLLAPPEPPEIVQIIRQPAREAGLRFEVEAVSGRTLDEVIRQASVKDTGALPLLSFLLDQLWQRRTDGGVLTFAAYEQLGGLEGAIGGRADYELAALPEMAKAAFPAVLRALVTVSQGASGAATARAVSLAHFPPGSASRVLVDAFLAPEARLLIADGEAGEARVRVAHEALLTHWERAKTQIAEDRSDLQLRARLEQAAALWEDAAAKDKTALLLQPGLPLSEAEDLVRRRPNELQSDVLAFVRASAFAVSTSEERRHNLTVNVAAAMAWLAIFTGFGAGFAYFGQQAADSQTKAMAEQLRWSQIAQSESLEEKARLERKSSNFDAALAIALNALPIERRDTARPWVESAADEVSRILEADPLRSIQLGHRDAVLRAFFTASGAELVTSSVDGTARLWDVRSGTPLGRFEGHDGAITALALSPAGNRIVTGSVDKSARIWKLDNRSVTVLKGHTGPIAAIAYSPSGDRIVTASEDRTSRLWDAESGSVIAILAGHGDRISAVAFHPAGDRVVTTSYDGTARLWDGRTGSLLRILTGHQGPVTSAVFSPSGDRVATSSKDGTAKLWDALAGVPIATLKGHDGPVSGIGYNPQGTLAVTWSSDPDAGMAGTGDKTARIWNARSGKPVAVLRGHEDAVTYAAFDPAGERVVTASTDRTVRLWDAKTGSLLATFNGHQQAATYAAFNPSGDLIVSASNDGTTRLWNAKTAVTAVLVGHGDAVSAAAFNPSGDRVVTASQDNTARLWNPQTGAMIAEMRAHLRPVVEAVFSPTGAQVATASKDGTARLWDAETGAPLLVLNGHEGPVRSVAFSASGDRIVTSSEDRTARQWDARTGKLLGVLKGHEGYVTAALYDPSGAHILTISTDKTARLWDAASNTQTASLTGHHDVISSAAFSPSGDRIATGSWDHTARLWDASNGGVIAEMKGHEGRILSVAFSPSGDRLATSSADGSGRVWDTRDGGPIAALIGHEDTVLAAIFSHDGKRVLTTSADKTSRLWDAGTGVEINQFVGHSGALQNIAINPHDEVFVSVSDDHTARVWKIPAPNADRRAVTFGRMALLSPLSAQMRKSLSLNDLRPADSRHEDSTKPNPCDDLAGDPEDAERVGPGVPEEEINAEQAIASCRLATDRDELKGRFPYQLGRALARSGQAAAAAMAYRQAIGLGYGAAFLRLGSAYWSGTGIVQDPKQAIRLWKKGARRGVAACHALLAEHFEKGEGVGTDFAKALYHHAVAALIFSREGRADAAAYETVRRGSLARSLSVGEATKAWQDMVSSYGLPSQQ